MSDEQVTNPEAPEVAAPTPEQAAPEVNHEESPLIEEGASPPDDDSEEIEHEGQKYRLPKALKGAVMMQADYTRKTQEVAAQRQALESEKQTLTQQAQFQQTYFKELAQLSSIDDQLEQYRKLDWNAIYEQNAAEHTRLTQQFALLKDGRERLLMTLQEKERTRTQETQRETAKRAEENRAYLAREIPDWSPELDKKLTDFALNVGFKPQEIQGLALANPRAIKVLHLAFLGEQMIQKQRTAAKPSPTPAIPVPKVGGNAPAGKAVKDMSPSEMARHLGLPNGR